MNNTTTYGKRLEGYNNVKAAYERESESFKKWAHPRATTIIFNARRVMEKYNTKQRQRGAEPITFSEFPWMTDRMYDLRIESYDERAITFSYATSYNYAASSWGSNAQKAKEPERHTFKFYIEWLSLSTWDFNKRVRNDIKRELDRRELDKKKEAEQKARDLRAKIRKAQAELMKQQEELKSLEEVYSS